jgi:hypothetical protein
MGRERELVNGEGPRRPEVAPPCDCTGPSSEVDVSYSAVKMETSFAG